MLQIVASLTDNSRGVIYHCNVYIVMATNVVFTKLLMTILQSLCKLGVAFLQNDVGIT